MSSSSSSSSDAPPSDLTYDAIFNAKVASLDTSAAPSSNPLPESEPTTLGEFMSERGAIVWLVRRPGCALCRAEAAQILPLYKKYFGDSDASGSANGAKPPLLVLVKENLDDELSNFLPSVHPAGRLLLHSDRSLYKALNQPTVRWWNLLSPSMLLKYRADKAAHSGNLKGEGMIKGALMVVGSREQGVLAVHLEEFGKEPDLSHVEEAMKQIKGGAAAKL